MAQLAQNPQVVPTNMSIDAVSSFGVDRGVGNLVGIQTSMMTGHYQTAVSYQTRLNAYMAAAQAQGWLHKNSIVIFPENIATWLLLVDVPRAVLQAPTIASAIQRMVWHNLPRFLWTLPHTQADNKAVDALFRMRASQMANLYQDTFAELARRYGVTLVAGSIILPEPYWENGRLQVSDGPLQNISCVFAPDGTPHPAITRKMHPVSEEQPLLQPGTLSDFPVYDTPAGRLGVLICADSWYPACYEPLKQQQVEIVVVPNNQSTWHSAWAGYAAPPIPEDVDANDIGTLTEREAWLKYALAGRLPLSGATVGMHVFFHGKMWDQVSTGQTIIVDKTSTVEASFVEGSALVNYWLK